MFDEKELEAKIIAYLEKKRYATIPMIARAVKSDFNTVNNAITCIRDEQHIFLAPIATIWSKKLNMKLQHYTVFVSEAVETATKITKAHKALQKRWLKKSLSYLDSRSIYLMQEHLKVNKSVYKTPPMYFLLSMSDIESACKLAADALPKP